jgi:excisionase family DNA binding protein
MSIAVPSALRRAEETPLSAKIAWSLVDAAKATSLSTRFIQHAVKRGELKPIRAGRRILFAPDAVRTWLESLQASAPSA